MREIAEIQQLISPYGGELVDLLVNTEEKAELIRKAGSNLCCR